MVKVQDQAEDENFSSSFTFFHFFIIFLFKSTLRVTQNTENTHFLN